MIPHPKIIQTFFHLVLHNTAIAILERVNRFKANVEVENIIKRNF